MKIGKIPENILKRSVIKQIQTKREEIISGAGIGEDCAIFSFGGGVMMTCMQVAAVKVKEIGLGEPICREAILMGHLIQRCANNLAASGAQPVGITIALMLPEETEEQDVRVLIAEAEERCSELNIQIAGGQTCISRAVKQPTAAVTGYGKPFMAGHGIAKENDSTGKSVGSVEEGTGEGESGHNADNDTRKEKPGRIKKSSAETVCAGQDVVVSKWIGLEGTAMLAGRYRKKLLERYPAYLVEEAAGFERLLSVIPEAATAIKSGVCMMHDASEGGIFGALWELAEKAGVGLTIDLKKIPLRQETVEVCECCNVNPYELLSGGALVMVTEDGPGLLAALEAEKIPAAIVGRTTDSNDRIIRNGEEIRFLDRPKNDEIYRQ